MTVAAYHVANYNWLTRELVNQKLLMVQLLGKYLTRAPILCVEASKWYFLFFWYFCSGQVIRKFKVFM